MNNSLLSKSLDDSDFIKVLLIHLWDRTDVNDNLCFLFNGAKTGDGYGLVRFDGRGWIVSKLVAYIYGLTKTPFFIDRNNVLHKCNNRNCWNPAHLYIGTQRQNGQDMINHRTHCKNGHPYSEYGYISKERNRLGNPVRRCRICRKNSTS